MPPEDTPAPEPDTEKQALLRMLIWSQERLTEMGETAASRDISQAILTLEKSLKADRINPESPNAA